MKVSPYRRAPEEETGPLPAPVKAKTESQDAQIEEVSTAFDHQITFGDNFNSAILKFDVADSATIKLSVKGLKGKPTRLMVDWTSVFSPWSHCWQVVDQSTIQFQIAWATPPSGTGKVIITVFGD